jgi:hypothetical protein
MNQRVLSQSEIEAIIARGGVPSAEEFDALFARWRALPPDIRDAEQTRLAASLSPEGNAAWKRQVWLLTYTELEGLADEALRALNGRNVPLRDAPGRAIDFWRFWKERCVAEASKIAR